MISWCNAFSGPKCHPRETLSQCKQAKLISRISMDMLDCQDQGFFDEMSTYLEDDLLKLSLFYQVQLLSLYSQKGLENPLFLCKVINAVNRNS